MPKSTIARTDAIAHLRDTLADDAVVFTIVRHVSKSGMSRDISPIVFSEGRPLYLHGYVGAALDWPITRDGYGAVKVQGAGMDMCFHMVDTLGRVIGRKLRHETL